MSKFNVFNVYISGDFVDDIKIKDIDKITFIKQGNLFGYFFPGYNVALAFKRGFKMFSLLLALSHLMITFSLSFIPIYYAFFCQICFSLFVLNTSSDIEEYFAKLQKKHFVTQIIANNQNEAQGKFFTDIYPQYINYRFYRKKLKSMSSQYYFNPDVEKIEKTIKINFITKTNDLLKKIKKHIVSIKDVKIGVFKK